MKIKYKHWIFRLMPRWAGMVIYPYVLFKRGPDEVSDRLFRHELEHYYQVQRVGWWKFYTTYLFYNLTEGYKNNPYEIEARNRENDELTQEERNLKNGVNN